MAHVSTGVNLAFEGCRQGACTACWLCSQSGQPLNACRNIIPSIFSSFQELSLAQSTRSCCMQHGSCMQSIYLWPTAELEHLSLSA